MAEAWRLIVDGPVDGALNMGVDSALLASRGRGGPPTLRVYLWARPTVSLGRFQRVEDVDLEACREAGIDVVRRPTGGRGVLHDREVTYSVVASEADGVPRGTTRSYVHLCSGLAEAYRLLGVPAEMTARERGARSAACYLHASRADLSLGAAKLSGSAQVWSGGCVLQHGSVVLARDAALEARAFRLGEGGALALTDAALTLADIAIAQPSVDEVVAALTSGFASALGVDLARGTLDHAEAEEAAARSRDARLGEAVTG